MTSVKMKRVCALLSLLAVGWSGQQGATWEERYYWFRGAKRLNNGGEDRETAFTCQLACGGTMLVGCSQRKKQGAVQEDAPRGVLQATHTHINL